ncbi:uncharacterized protein LOC117586436 isoform X1 [Drosophila guanche]|uniref:uncharacterized protein LOC117586436 isoform X1 n=1 Tax=Drosophila guanche TaxID=7266 RepID=UPI00147187F1|nr:uncharacterized protein LOC117586436 isoform X1 [Drosophila guanche]
MTTHSVISEIRAPPAGIVPHLKPWEVITWSQEQLGRIYSDWGLKFSRHQRYSNSIQYLNYSLNINERDTTALMRRCKVKRMKGMAPEALKDCTKADAILGWSRPPIVNPHVRLEISDTLYESNRFEDAKMNLHSNLGLFRGAQAKPSINRLDVVDENFKDMLRDETTPAVHRLLNRMERHRASQPKPIKDDCDVVSILETPTVFVSPLEQARRKRCFNIYNQTYLDKCWVDMAYLKKLRSNPNVLPQQAKRSTPYLRNLMDKNYAMARNLTKMLQARCPMYAKFSQRYPNEELYNKQKEENLYRVQYQTRRNMFKILRSIRQLIRVGSLDKLSTFIEEVMGDYITIKTHRTMPWKFEFINEVYNYLGLARINEYIIPSDMTVLQGKHRLLTLFGLSQESSMVPKEKQEQSKTMNVRRTDLTDPKSELFKKLSARYESRMRFAKYPIERAYLLHELAQAHLNNNSFNMAVSLARKAMEEATRCNSIVWSFLSLIVICKAHAIVEKVEHQKEVLGETFELAKRMKNLDLCLFIDICMKVNAEELSIKRMATKRSGLRSGPEASEEGSE